MANSEFSNIDFGFRYGSLEEIDRTSISNGIFFIDINNGNLFVDIDNNRISLSDIVFGYTETQIKSMPAPNNKMYFAKDTYNVLYFDHGELAWKIVGGEYSKYAIRDELGNIIHQTYETQENAITTSIGLQDQINALEQKVDTINRFDIKFYNSVESLPEIGTKFIIYIVPGTSDNEDESESTDNLCVEYVWIETEVGEGYYEQIGLATIDLQNYYTKSDADSIFETKADKSQSIASVSISNGNLNTTTVSGTENNTDIMTTIKNMVGINVITIDGIDYDDLNFGDEDEVVELSIDPEE